MSGTILVFVEHAGGEADRISLETLTFARRLAASTGGRVEAVLLGRGSAAVAGTLSAHGVAAAHVADDARLDEYAPAAWGAAIAGLAASAAAAAVVAPGTDRGNEVLAHAAARADLPMAANVLEVAGAGPSSAWRITRQRWAGSLLEDAMLDAPVHFLSMAPHAVPVEEVAGGPPAVSTFAPAISDADLRVRVVGRDAPVAGSVSLGDARVVVGGGRGVGSAAGFAALEELAGLLGGTVGVSRAVTSLGWRPHAEQVGQTGSRIAPEIYIACGISGAIQHIVGCKAAKRILAVNTDPDSPIMGVADYAVIGDLNAIVPAITAEIRRRGRQASGI